MSGGNGGAPLRLFEGFGIELEYMIVDRETLSVRPIADEVLRAAAGDYVTDFEENGIAWSNELVLHVIELKTNGPASALEPLPEQFDRSIGRINDLLAPLDGMLLPTGMHPWMDPATETRLWPHDYNPVYQAFDRIFDCRGHGWSNLQSMHLNLPFGDDEEFGRLHAAIRLLMPIMPALAASSPVMDGVLTGAADNRLEVYSTNSRRIPSVSGNIVPEPVFTRADYEGVLLERIYRDLAPHDPEGILRYEWVNARGAIARFDRDAIEIRVLDVQECPRADLAVAAGISAVLRGLVEERWCDVDAQRAWSVGPLAAIFSDCAQRGGDLVIGDRAYLEALGHPGPTARAAEVWRNAIDRVWPAGSSPRAAWLPVLEVVLERGTLARRIERALDGDPSRFRLREVYRELSRCLAEDRLFLP